MTVVSRLELDHPALGTAGGAGLHASIQALYLKLGNNIADRLFYAENLASAASVDLDHNYGVGLSAIRWDLYLWDPGTQVLTRITSATSPALSAFTVAEVSGLETTQVRLTNGSGAERDLVLMLYNDPIEILNNNDIKDVDMSVAIEDGQTLVYDAASSKLKPGASGDASFKIQSISTPNAVIKGGYLLLDNGKELATYDGAGSASTDFGKDITVSLTTIFGSAPANATAYYLYIDLNSLGAPVTLSDNGRKVYAVVEANFVLSTTVPDAIDLNRYVPRAVIKSATTGTAWSGSGSGFATLAFLAGQTVDGSLKTFVRPQITQASHGFVANDLGAPLYINGSGVYVKAKADSDSTASVAGFIYSIIDANTFVLALFGEITVGSSVSGALTVGSTYYLSATTAGAITATEPTTIGQISKSVGIAKSTTVLDFVNDRKKTLVPSEVSGGRNYFASYFDGTNPVGTVTNGLTATGNRSSGSTTWGADNTSKLTIANNTTTPLRQTGDFKLTHVAVGTAFVESPMVQLDNADLSKAVVLSLDLTGNTLAGDFDVVVVRYNSSGTYQETISVAGTASSGTPASAQLPTGTTKFSGFFISSNTQADYYSVRFRRLSAVATTSVQFDSFFAGPQSIVTGAIVTDWETDTNIVTQGFGTLASTTIQRRRVGNTIYYRGYFTTGTVTATEARFYLPTGLTIGGIGGATQVVGHGTRDATSIGKLIRILGVSGNNYVTFTIMADNNTAQTLAVSENGDAISGSSARMLLEFSVPISSWTSNTQLAERAVEEYGFNTGNVTAAGANDLTSFGNGIHGTPILSYNSTTANSYTYFRVKFSSPRVASTLYFVEFNDGKGWFPVTNRAMGLTAQGTSVYGVSVEPETDPTLVTVYFGNKGWKGSNASYAGDGSPWSSLSGWYWRVRAVNGGASVGYPIGARNIVGDTTGTAVPSGYIGQVLEANASTAAFTAATDIVTVTLTSGVWQISGALYGNSGTAGAQVMTSTWKIKGTTGTTGGKDQLIGTSVSTERGCITMPTRIVYVADADADKTVKIRHSNSISQSTESYILAVRIA